MLATGVASMIIGISLTLKIGRESAIYHFPMSTGEWVSTWLCTALCAFIVSLFLARKQASIDGHPMNTPQLRHIFRCLAPSLMLGFVAGTLLSFHDVRYLPAGAALWVSSYGIALLSIRLYATKSARFLGVLMLALGLACLWVSLRTMGLIHPMHLANFYMCIAFGMFHLIVASGSILFAKAQA
ncbi:hypothetical protein [Rubritalea tangerina]